MTVFLGPLVLSVCRFVLLGYTGDERFRLTLSGGEGRLPRSVDDMGCQLGRDLRDRFLWSFCLPELEGAVEVQIIQRYSLAPVVGDGRDSRAIQASQPG